MKFPIMYNKEQSVIFKKTLWPLRVLMYFSGALPFEFKCEKQTWRTLLIWRLVHSTILVTIVGYLYIVRFLRFHEVIYKHNDSFSNVMDRISYSSLVLSHAIVYWENTWKAHHYNVIFEHFEIIRRQFNDLLQITINLRRMRLHALLLYTLPAIYFIVIAFVTFIFFINSLNALRLLIAQYGDLILKLKLTEFAIFATIVMSIQLDLNAYTLSYMNEVKGMQLLGWPKQREVLRKFYILQDLHNNLAMTMRCIEDYFAWSLPGLLLKMFLEITIQSYWIYFSAEFKVSALFQFYDYAYISLQVGTLFVTCYICSKCEKLDKEFCHLIHIMKHERINPYTNSCLNEITLQLLHQKIFFSAGGFVDVNYNLLGKFLFSAVCYTVILIQFHMSV